MFAQRQITKLMKTEETRYQTRDVPRLQTLETALIEQREPQRMSGRNQQINRQREKSVYSWWFDLKEPLRTENLEICLSQAFIVSWLHYYGPEESHRTNIRRNPDVIVMHVGTNNLRSSTSVRDCAEEIINLATMISNESSADLTISGIILRSDDEVLAVKVSGVNKIPKTFCNQNGLGVCRPF